MYIASITLPELAPILTIFVGMLAGFYALVKFILSQAEKTALADRDERKEMSIAFNRVAEATEKSAREAKDRNGHLGDQNIQIAKLVTAQNLDVSVMREISVKNLEANDRVVEILSKSALIAAEDRDSLVGNGSQVVIEQIVEKQVVNSKG